MDVSFSHDEANPHRIVHWDGPEVTKGSKDIVAEYGNAVAVWAYADGSEIHFSTDIPTDKKVLAMIRGYEDAKKFAYLVPVTETDPHISRQSHLAA